MYDIDVYVIYISHKVQYEFAIHCHVGSTNFSTKV